ncbi:uncharacterized protein [Rutidosis leptorrhynchoides]|uniref:uncharacterized protein n=1 Tax=Rutidosis leptorrhynchoides TaxID=125765 RepID=UPI003A99951D
MVPSLKVIHLVTVPRIEYTANVYISRTPSVAHHQANGQCEVTNRDIILGIKARLGLCRRGWIDELPNVLWAHRTTPKGATNETPFSLVYRSEAVIPAEINVPTMCIASFDESSKLELHNLVWRKHEANRAEDTGKLGPKWEGPYKVIGVSDTGAYRLVSLDGKAIKRVWHAQTLKQCYI